jgi:hypothetical protein
VSKEDILPDLKRHSLVKPTIQTQFHIDFDWWAQNDNDWRVYLMGLLCQDHQEAFQGKTELQMVDFVDRNTAEVQRVDGLQHVLITHCAKEPGFITPHTTVVDAIFRLLLASGNEPMTPAEMAGQLNRPAEMILRTLTGGRVYRGVRPWFHT